MFEKTFVKTVEDKSVDYSKDIASYKVLNVPVLDPHDGKLMRAMNEERVAMLARVDQERDRALAAESDERARAMAAEMWLNDLIESYSSWHEVHALEAPLPADGQYAYSIQVTVYDSSDISPVGAFTVVMPATRQRSTSGTQCSYAVCDGRIYRVSYVNDVARLYVPLAGYPEQTAKITNVAFMTTPWAYTDGRYNDNRSRISALEARISALEKRI